MLTLTFVLSIVSTSPTLKPVLPACIVMDAIFSSDVKVKFAVAFIPFPVKEINGILFWDGVSEYPLPLLIISVPVIFEPWPSIIPVILLFSGSAAVPELIFLPIGKLETVRLVPVPSIFNFNFLGRVCIGFNGSTWVFKLPASTGVL